MRQYGLIDRLIAQLVINGGAAKYKWNPAEAKPLVNDEDGLGPSGNFRYSNVVGMMLYLSGNTHQDITYAVNCSASYMFYLRHYLEFDLKTIGKQLKGTINKGLILNHSKDFYRIDCYPDADFAGMYVNKKPTETSCVKSITFYCINFRKFTSVVEIKIADGDGSV